MKIDSKKALIFLLPVAIVLVLSGCGGSDSSDGSGSSSSDNSSSSSNSSLSSSSNNSSQAAVKRPCFPGESLSNNCI